jgi:hypothetical protein
MKGREQDGIFILSSPSEFGKVCHLFGASGKLKQAMGLRWEIHISQLPQASEDRDKLIGQKQIGIIETIKAIISKIKKSSSALIVLPANNPRSKYIPGL